MPTDPKLAQMKVDTDFDDARLLMHFTVTGRLDLAELFAYAGRAVSHPAFKRGMSSLWDLRRAGYEHLFAPDLQMAGAIPRSDANERGEARVAIVVADALGHGLTRIFEASAGLKHLTYRVFNDVDPAMNWLNETGSN